MNLTSLDLAVIQSLILDEIAVLKSRADNTPYDEVRLAFLEQVEKLNQTLHHVEEARKCV